jgi:hypothetical protein
VTITTTFCVGISINAREPTVDDIFIIITIMANINNIESLLFAFYCIALHYNAVKQAEEINRQRVTTAQLSRSASIGDDMTPSSLNPIRDGTRRALYGTLPFYATYGMHRREHDVRRVLSSVSFKSMQDLASMSEFGVQLEEVDVDEVSENYLNM